MNNKEFIDKIVNFVADSKDNFISDEYDEMPSWCNRQEKRLCGWERSANLRSLCDREQTSSAWFK